MWVFDMHNFSRTVREQGRMLGPGQSNFGAAEVVRKLQQILVPCMARFPCGCKKKGTPSHAVYVVWCGVVWCGVVWCGVVWCGVVWCGVVWCGVVWCGVVWCGVVWCGVVWCGVVWCGVVWCGVPKALLPKGKRPGCLPTGTGKRAGLCVLCARCA